MTSQQFVTFLNQQSTRICILFEISNGSFVSVADEKLLVFWDVDTLKSLNKQITPDTMNTMYF